MANTIYPKYREAHLDESATNKGLNSTNVKAALIDLADYTYSTAHDFLDDVAGAAIVATTSNLASKTITDGVFDSADPSFSSVTGDISEAVILYIDTGTAATSRLVAYFDTGVTGLPVTPNGGNINLTVNASGWFAI